ncbi:MAG TPA: adenylate/guanylate cyclase domain-containing protein [Polyangiaceae bacterium]|nr:adenylate/guanylate cyclase domain-containing protein [Polyangiaceae bacterium]
MKAKPRTVGPNQGAAGVNSADLLQKLQAHYDERTRLRQADDGRAWMGRLAALVEEADPARASELRLLSQRMTLPLSQSLTGALWGQVQQLACDVMGQLEQRSAERVADLQGGDQDGGRDAPPAPELQVALDLVADFLFVDGIRFAQGLDVRRRMAGDNREAKRACLQLLVPAYVRLHGSAREDSYSLTPLGTIWCKHSALALALAAELHDFAKTTFGSGRNSFTWDEVRHAVHVDGRDLAERDLELTAFIFFCIGVWGRSGTTWSRPPAEQLEDLLEVPVTRNLFLRVHQDILQQQQLAGMQATSETIRMANKSMTFQDAIRLVTGSPGDIRYDAHIAGVRAAKYMDCGAPPWDPDGTYRLALEDDRLVVQHWLNGQWSAAPISPPSSSSQPVSSSSMRTETRSILFMDLAGWSKLSPPQVLAYLEKALPRLAQVVKRFGAQHVNTWGDALVATFSSVGEAANCALDVRDFFRRTSEADGVPEGLVPRVALHVGEVIIATNPLIDKPDIFGDAVHLAARLEPVAGKGDVCCTSEFAVALQAIRGIGPKAYLLGEVTLPKGFGVTRLFAVTGPNEPPPIPAPTSDPGVVANAAPIPEPLSDDETAAQLRVLLRSLTDSCILTYEKIIERCHPLVSREAVMRTLPLAAKDFDWKVTIGRETVSFEYEMPTVVVSSEPRRGW